MTATATTEVTHAITPEAALEEIKNLVTLTADLESKIGAILRRVETSKYRDVRMILKAADEHEAQRKRIHSEVSGQKWAVQNRQIEERLIAALRIIKAID